MKGLYLTLALILGTAEANAITIRFDDADRPPSDTLNVSGVTVAGGTWGGPGTPATAVGFGLGSDVLGSSFAMDRVAHYSSGNWFSDGFSRESLRLSVDGVIDSITIMPRISVLETGESLDGLRFEFMASFFGSPSGFTTVEFNGTSTTILNPVSNPWYALASSVDLIITGDFGEDFYFVENRISRGLPEETIVFGFSILSLDYTQASGGGTAVPDAANSTCLLGIGLFAIVCAGLKRDWFARR